MILAGFDEAGYGPRLGPLCVAWTAFRVPSPGEPGTCLWKTLRSAVRKTASGPKAKVWVADSKVVKPRKDGLALLELAVLSFVGPRASLGELLGALGGTAARYDGAPWYGGLGDVRLPAFGCWGGEVAARVARLGQAYDETGVRFAGAEAVVLPEWEFNSGFRTALGPEGEPNKADILQRVAFVPLLRSLRARFPGEALHVVADKHGGRDHYVEILSHAFPRATIDVHAEGERSSSYTLVEPDLGPLTIRFEPEADGRHFAVALASMTCKYLRELFMGRLNAFFLERVGGELRPTAGYPGDAERFLTEVEPALARLGIERERFVRAR